jgi:GT2 family glycosyltransferase
LRIRYGITLYRSATRPVIRFQTEAGEMQIPMPAALFGAGEWIGHVPVGTRAIWISLSSEIGTDGFRLISCEVLSRWHLLAFALKSHPRRAFGAALLRPFVPPAAARALLGDLLGATPLHRYHEWRAKSFRPLDPTDLEAPRNAWRSGPHLRVVILSTAASTAALSRTYESLLRQQYPNWSVVFVGGTTGIPGDWKPASKVPACVDPLEDAGALWSDIGQGDIVVPLVAGDVVPAYALAVLAEFAVAHPDTHLFYGDEDSIEPGGRHVAPELKPDWSPIFQLGRPYVGRAIYVRRSMLERHGPTPAGRWLCAEKLYSFFAHDVPAVGHIRRVLLTKPRSGAPASQDDARAAQLGEVASPSVSRDRVRATIIIPTRDKAELLAACLSGLERTGYKPFDVVVVDNGSVEAETREVLERAVLKLSARILKVAAPFNFSALCNRAAAVAEGRVLVFLNNDTRPLRKDWLDRLVHWAVRRDVGAVGAKLLYPSGRLQHAGVVLGLGGYAAHVESGADGACRGYLDRLTVPHEVSAVTAACLAVEAAKFASIGGFDAEKFPVELGDVDLCLRLAQRGWKTVLAADSILEHHESVTRGRAPDLAVRYAHERGNFLSDWKDVVVDDPCFHPALSLTSVRTSLDG